MSELSPIAQLWRIAWWPMVQLRADCQRSADVGMEHRPILDVAPFPDQNELVVSPQYRREPDARLGFELDPAEHGGIGGDPILTVGR